MIDWVVVLALAMLGVWGYGTVHEWAGWVHALLTGGVFLLIWRIVSKGKSRRTP